MASVQPRGGGIIWSIFFTNSKSMENGEIIHRCNSCQKKVSDHPKNGFHHVFSCLAINQDERAAGLNQIPHDIMLKYQSKKDVSKKRKRSKLVNQVPTVAIAGDNDDDGIGGIDDMDAINATINDFRTDSASDLYHYADLPATLGLESKFKLHERRRKHGPKFTGSELLSSLGVLPAFPNHVEILRGQEYIHDGVIITEVNWWVGYGPRTRAYLLQAEMNRGLKQPGVLYLHSHDDVKQFGKEKVVDGPIVLPPHLSWVKDIHYGGRAPANELAKRGFVVLVHDAFLWGSRGFPMESMPRRLRELVGTSNYELLAVMHESMVLAKYLSICGSTLAGLINFDDRVALQVLHQLPEVAPGGVGVVGLSGGGCRALLLHAVSPHNVERPLVRGTVSVGAMATYKSMLDTHVAPHSWMFFPNDLASHCDWPDVAVMGQPKPLFVQYCAHDALFTRDGMQQADRIIAAGYDGDSRDVSDDFHRVSSLYSINLGSPPQSTINSADISFDAGMRQSDLSLNDSENIDLAVHIHHDGNPSTPSGIIGSALSATVTLDGCEHHQGREFAREDLSDLMGMRPGCSAYKSSFYPEGHCFSISMQNDAFDWLAKIMNM